MIKREKIILAVTAVVVVAGTLYFIMGQGPKAPPDSARVDLKVFQDFTSLTDEALKKAALTETQDRILERASAEWTSDPFLGRKPAAEAAKAVGVPVSLAYTGFVIMGQERLAIINGMDYQVGEMVLGSDLVVQAIDPQNVVVKQLGGRESLSIPFTGEVLR